MYRLAGALSCVALLAACSGSAPSSDGDERVGATAEPLLAACDQSSIRAESPASAMGFWDKAFSWVNAGLMYCQCVESGSSGYRADCSGLVSYAWGLPAPGHTTYSFAGGPWDDGRSVRISWAELTPGDALNFPGNPSSGTGHIMLFGGWLDAAHTRICAVEEYNTGHPASIRTHSTSDPASWWGGSGTFDQAFLPIRLAGYTPTPPENPPRGYLDAANCTGIGGWAQDVDTPGTAINVHIYFNGPAGAAGVTAIPLLANQNRADLCTAIGSCDHGFTMAAPRSLMDGAGHQVNAYGIDSTPGANNSLLAQSPQTLTCAPPPIPSGSVKRHITSPDVLNAWKFNPFMEMAPYAASVLDAIPDGELLDAPPSLVQETGHPEVYVSDHGFKRHVVDGTSFNAWRFDYANVKQVDAATLAALQAGPDWPAAPELANTPGAPPVYLLDVPLPAPPPPDASVPAGASDLSTSGGGYDAAVPGGGPHTPNLPVASSNFGGCSLSASARLPGGTLAIAALALLLAVAQRRRNSRQVCQLRRN